MSVMLDSSSTHYAR
jgi:hypothetical protein